MSRRRYLVFAAPLVVTVALGGCGDKKSGEPAPEPEPEREPARNPPAPPDPAPPADAAVALIHPTQTVWQKAGMRITYDPATSTCSVTNERTCPQGQICPPTDPRPAACPAQLLPSLPAGVLPVRQGDGCFAGDIQVRCP